jgi:hypothetical protein
MEDVDATRLRYPILCLSQDSSITVARNGQEFCRCNALALWGNNYYRRMYVFDTEATPYLVTSAAPVPPFSVIGRFLARLFNRRIQVRITLERTGDASLDDAKQRATEWLDRSPEFWEASADISEWKNHIAKAPDMEVLMSLFA